MLEIEHLILINNQTENPLSDYFTLNSLSSALNA